MDTILSVKPIPGESGRFFVTSRTLFCADTNGCRFSYQHRGDGCAKFSVGDQCPKCAKAKLETVDYLVDLAEFNGLSRCGCHRWTMYYQPLISRMSPTEILQVRASSDFVCVHIQAARIFFALEQIDNLNRATARRGREDGE